MLKAVGKLMNKGKRVGFLLQDANGKIKEYSDNKIKQLMKDGETFDITYDSRGFRFKNKGRTISELKEKDITGVMLSKKEVSTVVVDEYTGAELKNFILQSAIQNYKNRNFVQAILEYIESNEIRVLSIDGLRGTGKTTGILQAIRMINDFDSTVFINIDELSNMTCLDLRNLILNKYSHMKYVFIDEITRIKDLVNNSAFLSDNLCRRGIKVIISGTDSLALTSSEHAGLYHRMINLNVTHISYSEAKNTAGQSLKEYIEMGGLYKAQKIDSIEGLRDYIDTSVIDNIMNTLTRNKGISALLSIENISKQKLRTIVFRIIYAVIYSIYLVISNCEYLPFCM